MVRVKKQKIKIPFQNSAADYFIESYSRSGEINLNGFTYYIDSVEYDKKRDCIEVDLDPIYNSF